MNGNFLFLWENTKLQIFPKEVFPETIERFVSELSRSTETPLDLAALTTLSAIATTVHHKYVIQTKEDHVEPLNILTLVALPPGSRKSAVQSKITRPIEKFELQVAEKMQPIIAEVVSKNKTLEARIKELRLKAAKAPPDKFESLQREVQILEEEIQEAPLIPQLWTSDITPENLGTLMQNNDECMAVLSDEAGIFDILGGRYSSGIPNLDLFLKSHSGSPARINRGTRPSDLLERAILTIGLTPQPEVLKGIASNSVFRGRGLLGRFLYALPRSNLGFRSLNEAPMQKQAMQDYETIIETLLKRSRELEEIVPLYLSKEAYEVWYLYSLAIEIKMSPEGPFAFMTDWAGKLAGQIARIAGLLHLARYATCQSLPEKVAEEDMKKAVAIGHYLSDHALAVFDLMGADPAHDGARVILSWIKRKRLTEFSFRDCQNENKRFKKASDLKSSIEILIDKYYLIEREPEKMPHRRKRIFDVNPELYKEELENVPSVPID